MRKTGKSNPTFYLTNPVNGAKILMERAESIRPFSYNVKQLQAQTMAYNGECDRALGNYDMFRIILKKRNLMKEHEYLTHRVEDILYGRCFREFQQIYPEEFQKAKERDTPENLN